MKDDTASNTVGLIGVGLLGKALAERLLAAGFELRGHDIAAEAMSAFAALGGQPVERAAEVAASCQQIVLCLPNSDIVEAVVAELLPSLKAGSIVIDTTTGEPSRSRAVAARVANVNADLIDASILGSSEVTRSGEAVILAGGSEAGLRHASPLLDAISHKLHHVGPVGCGQEMKLVANLVLGLNRAVLAEGLHFARTFDLDLKVVLDVLKSGAAYSAVMDAKGEKMIDGDFAPQAKLSQHLKDVRLILNHAASVNQSLPLSEAHRRLLETAEGGGCGDLDNSAVIRAWAVE